MARPLYRPSFQRWFCVGQIRIVAPLFGGKNCLADTLRGRGEVRDQVDFDERGTLMRQIGASSAILGATLMCAALAGCAGARPYSEVRDKQAIAAKKAWADVDLTSQITVSRNNLAAMLAHQLLTADRLGAAQRASTIRSMATGGTLQLKLRDPVTDELTTLFGSVSAAQEWDKASDAEQDAKSRHAKIERAFTYAGIEAPTCKELSKPESKAKLDSLANEQTNTAAIIKSKLQDLSDSCLTQSISATKEVKLGDKSHVGELLGTLSKEKEQLDSTRQQTQVARIQFKVAAEAHAAALKEFEIKKDDTSKAKVAKALNKLQDALESFKDAPDVFSQKFLTEERLATIDQFFEAALNEKSEKTPDDANKIVRFIAFFPEWHDEAKKDGIEAKRPMVFPLVLRKQYEQIQLDALVREISLRENRVRLLEERLAIHSQQGKGLLSVNKTLDAMHQSNPGTFSMSYQDVTAPIKAGTTKKERAKAEQAMATRKVILEATGRYLDATSRLHLEAVKLEHQYGYAEQAIALSYAEANMSQWNTLIGGGIDQLADFGASGLKAETILAFINSATLLWIGQGVNK